ncbi:MAG: hypothetical protein ACFFAT_08830 [Promethearchaeota archaeon]
MKNIKGSLLKNFVIAIRANRSGVYEEFITDEDWKIINQRILDAAWYPYETFKNCFNAVCKVEAKDNIKIIEQWGYDYGNHILDRIYKEPMRKRDLETAMNSYNGLFKLWFNFGKQHGEIISDNEIHVFIEDFDKDFRLFYYNAIGWMRGFFNKYLSTRVTTEFLEKSWEGADKTVVKITWNS